MRPALAKDKTVSPEEAREGRRRRSRKKKKKRRNRRRRKRKKEQSDTEDISIVLTNCKGYTSKEESRKKDIMEGKAPEVILLNETLLTGARKIKADNYLAFCRNRDRKERKKGDKVGSGEGAGAGGVATLIAKHLQSNTVKAGEGREGDEYLITRLNHVKPALNIINIYGENENRAGAAKVLESWIRLKQDLDEIKGRGELILLMGYMNRAIGSGQFGVRGTRSRSQQEGNCSGSSCSDLASMFS